MNLFKGNYVAVVRLPRSIVYIDFSLFVFVVTLIFGYKFPKICINVIKILGSLI